jgi:hypothetical protein
MPTFGAWVVYSSTVKEPTEVSRVTNWGADMVGGGAERARRDNDARSTSTLTAEGSRRYASTGYGTSRRSRSKVLGSTRTGNIVNIVNALCVGERTIQFDSVTSRDDRRHVTPMFTFHRDGHY